MEEFIIHSEFTKLLGGFVLGAIIITSIIHFVFRKNRIIKYTPGLILIVMGLYNLFLLGRDSSSMDGFNRLLTIIVLMISGLMGLATGLIIGIVRKGKE